MNNKNANYEDVTYLREDQYRNGRNLNARAEIHRRFSTSKVNWHEWVFDHMELKPANHVLECGCGPGWLWGNNVARIPADCQITLVDLSPGMVAEAQGNLAAGGHDFRFQETNIETLPFPDNNFDVVVANHMLYHVANRPRGLAEIRRVLKSNGRFLAATNGADHMQELKDLIGKFLPDDPQLAHMYINPFTLENGRDQLTPFFNNVQLLTYPDSLAVTEIEPLIAYLLSSSGTRAAATPELLQKISDYIQQVIDSAGAFHITKSMGLFVAN